MRAEPGSLSEPRAKKPVYFEWAKKIWESEETFKLPDGTFWPYVSSLIQESLFFPSLLLQVEAHAIVEL